LTHKKGSSRGQAGRPCTDGFDQHLIDVFTPASRIGLDDRRHSPAESAAQKA
jgi:hypothetical protein